MPTTKPRVHRERRRQDQAALDALAAATHAPASSFLGAVRLTGTIEKWLDITEEKEGSWKAANIAASLNHAYADPASPVPGRVRGLLALMADLFDGVDPAPHPASPDFQGALIERKLALPSLNLAAEVATFPRASCACAPSI
ncbi:hypothetical protein [Actinomadura sp. NEAU-AAG7]|uniref:hypothetical protein n=1 Tax=Actinomadura sp. NEAU-AAG7 TaxID=2839640 RepID=UPI001BE48750|nr:hypothetical protein [Actinomadura sp. NEAU-AAG7]MBT2207504.1 hypothetical protein [Actinomadura sp. NEAU-AAG7]